MISINDEHENFINTEESLGVETEKPWFLQPGKETSELVDELWSHMEEEILDVKENPIQTSILGKQV